MHGFRFHRVIGAGGALAVVFSLLGCSASRPGTAETAAGHAAASAAAPPGAPVADARAMEAVVLYDQGRYAEARALLAQLDGESRATGPLLYRLSFCERQAGEAERSLETLHRARALLESELPGSTSLETPFYLVNAYQQLERTEDVRKLAAATTTQVEAGERPPAEDAVDMFRLGKLYADQGRREEATLWYERALAIFEATPEQHGAYIRWARGYLGAGGAPAPPTAPAHAAAKPTTESGLSVEELDRQAVEHARAGRYAEARASWRQAELLNPAEADRARYCQNLARMASELEAYPALAPDGRPWSELSREDLEAVLREQALVSAEVKQRVSEAGEALSREERLALNEKLLAAKPAFAAAGLEYALRGLPIRETAFLGGYAPMIFQQDAWIIPRPPGKSGFQRKPTADRPARPASGS